MFSCKLVFEQEYHALCFKYQIGIYKFLQHQQTHSSTIMCFIPNYLLLDVPESVRRDTIVKATNKMQLCRLIYFSSQLYMFWAMFSPIIRSTWLYL